MKSLLLLPMLLLMMAGSAQVIKNPKVVKLPAGSQTPPIKTIPKKDDKGKLDAGRMSKDLGSMNSPYLSGRLARFTAKSFVKTLGDGTKLTTRMFINGKGSTVTGGKITPGVPKTTTKSKSQKEETKDGWICKSEQIKISLDDESFMNAANEQQSSNLYPGAIYTFDNFFKGSFKAETAPRRAMRITTSAQGVSGNVYEVVETPTVSNIKNSINKLFNRMPKSNAISGYRSKIYECNSLAEQMLKINGGGGAYGFSASFGVETGSKNEYRNFLIDCTQEMYSLSAEMPDSGLFINPADAGKDGLMMIGNVTYGQRVLVSLTTKITSNEFGTNFDAKYSGFGASANIGLETLAKESSDETTVKIYIVGGTNEGFISTNKNELMSKLNQYFKNTRLQNAKPISYQFKNMNDEVVQSQSATDFFPVQRCIPAPPPGVNSADIKWKITINLNSVTNETDMQESIHLGIHQLASIKNIARPVLSENHSANNPADYLIYWGGYPMPATPYEEPRTFKRNTNPQKTMSFIISQKDAEDGAYLSLVSNYIAMVSTRIAGKDNESTRKYEQKYPLMDLITKMGDLKEFSINFNNRVFKFQYKLSAQKL